jgi:hypothetical protein
MEISKIVPGSMNINKPTPQSKQKQPRNGTSCSQDVHKLKLTSFSRRITITNMVAEIKRPLE